MSPKHEAPEDPAEAALARAARAFDAQEVVFEGDEALAARMAERALAVARASRPPPEAQSRLAKRGTLVRLRGRGLLVAAVVGFAAAGAAAAGGYVVLSRAPVSSLAFKPQAPSMPHEPPARPRQGSSAPTEAPRSEASTQPEQPKVVVAPPAREQEAPVTPESLFSKGNAERRGGRTAEAMGSYELLLRRFADSSEAQVARVSLGNLLLAQGQAARALASFDAHLNRGSQLGAEALYGKARALRALGKPVEARQVWKALVAQYPDSIYARSAPKRGQQDD